MVRTATLPWQPWTAPEPFRSRVKLARTLPLEHVGLHLQALTAGFRSCPLHDHLFEEEQFYVLSGVLTVTERTPEGVRREFELRAGELVVYPPGTGLAHGFSNRGAQDVFFLAFSDRHPGDVCTYPDSDKTNFRSYAIGAWRVHGGTGIESTTEALDPAAWRARARARREQEKLEQLSLGGRPAHVVPLEVAEAERGRGRKRLASALLSRAGGAQQVFLNRDRLPPGCVSSELHRHRFNEEAVLLVEGHLTLRQRDEAGDETLTTLQPGDLVYWRPSDPYHQLRNHTERDALYLTLGTDVGWDVLELPERDLLYSAALDQMGRLEVLDYFDGEAESPGAAESATTAPPSRADRDPRDSDGSPARPQPAGSARE